MGRVYVNQRRGRRPVKSESTVKQGGHPMRVALVHDWLPVFSGATILGDGRPALILDAGGLTTFNVQALERLSA